MKDLSGGLKRMQGRGSVSEPNVPTMQPLSSFVDPHTLNPGPDPDIVFNEEKIGKTIMKK